MINPPPNDDTAVEPASSPQELPVADIDSSDKGEGRSIHRVLIALDASVNSNAALEAAVNLAETLKSEVLGLFVEDINLIRLTELPFVREVRFAERDLQRLEQESVQRSLRARAALLRHELEELTTERKITSSFRVIRGPVDRELLAAALESDLIALGRLGHSVTHRTRLGSTAQAIVRSAASAVLLVKTGVGPGPVIALYDGSAMGERALLLAAELADQVGDLRILVWALDEQTAYGRRQRAIELLEKADVQLQFQHLSGDDPGRVIEWVNRQKGSLLLLGGGERNLPDNIVQILLDEAQQHILFIR